MSEVTQPVHHGTWYRMMIMLGLLLALGIPEWALYKLMGTLLPWLTLGGIGGLLQTVQIQWLAMLITRLMMFILMYIFIFVIGYLIKRIYLETNQTFLQFFDSVLDDIKTASSLMFIGMGFLILGLILAIGCIHLGGTWNYFSGVFMTLFGVWGLVFYGIGFGWSFVSVLTGVWSNMQLSMQNKWFSGGMYVFSLIILIGLVVVSHIIGLIIL